MRIWQAITLLGETVFGLNSTTATPTTLQRVWGNVTANSRIFLSGGNHHVHVSARVAGASFAITSASGSDTANVDWIIIEP